jgi:hypothetical protein
MAKHYDPMEELRKRVAGRKQKAFALSVPCSQGYLSDVLSGKVGMSKEIIAALGLEEIKIYRKVKKQ